MHNRFTYPNIFMCIVEPGHTHAILILEQVRKYTSKQLRAYLQTRVLHNSEGCIRQCTAVVSRCRKKKKKKENLVWTS